MNIRKLNEKLKAIIMNEALGSAEYEGTLEQILEGVEQLKHDFNIYDADFEDTPKPDFADLDEIIEFLDKVKAFVVYQIESDILDAINSKEDLDNYFSDLVNIINL